MRWYRQAGNVRDWLPYSGMGVNLQLEHWLEATVGKDTFQLFHTLPTVTEGMARVLDITGRGVDDGYVVSSTSQEADARAIGSDWSAVMGDLMKSAGAVGKSSKG